MLFHREPVTDEDEIRLYVPEEQTTTPTNLLGIGMFAAFGFLAMAALSQPETRGAPLFVGALIIGLLALTGGFLKWQSRYGEATLKAKTPFIHGARFEGWIATELTTVPPGSVKVKIEARRGKYTAWIVSTAVPPERIRKDAAGKVRVPFALDVPEKEPGQGDVRLMVRTQTWPVGWGATFLLA